MSRAVLWLLYMFVGVKIELILELLGCRSGGDISEFTQQDGRLKRTAKRLSVTHMTLTGITELLLTCYVVILTKH